MKKITMCLSACAVLTITSSVVFGMDPNDGKRSAEHRCPTDRVMRDPVVAADGNVEAPLRHSEKVGESASSEEQSASAAGKAPTEPVTRSLELAIPYIAREYEEMYERFSKGGLTYRPNPASDEGKIEMPIRDLDNPLDGTFYLSI